MINFYIFIWFAMTSFCGDTGLVTDVTLSGTCGLSVILAQERCKWTRKNITVTGVPVETIQVTGVPVETIQVTNRSNLSDTRITCPLERRIQKFKSKFTVKWRNQIAAYKRTLRSDKLACKMWPETNQTHDVGLTTQVLGATLYLQYINWAIAMEEKSAKENKISERERSNRTYAKLQKGLEEWREQEIDLVSIENNTTLSLPFPPLLDASSTNYGIAITNLMMENLYLFLQCLNSDNDNCQVWGGCKLVRLKKQYTINSKCREPKRRKRTDKKRKRKIRKLKRKRKGQKERKGKTGKKRQKVRKGRKERKRKTKHTRRNKEKKKLEKKRHQLSEQTPRDERRRRMRKHKRKRTSLF